MTPIEAKELIVNDLTKNADVQKYFKLVDNDGFESDIAIASIKYCFDSKDRIRLEALSQELFNGNRRLKQEEAITCVAYGFKETEQVQSYIDRLEKDYGGNKLDLFEAALCTVHNLDPATTERFFKLKSMQLPYKKEDGTDDVYTLSAQEAVLCAKAELDEDELKRYAELKNIPYMYTAVREHNSAKAPSTELIIAYIKDKQSDEEIAQWAKLGIKDAIEHEDYKKIALNFGVNPRAKNPIIAYITKLHPENDKNIFKDEDGNFDFRNLDLYDLTDLILFDLTIEETKTFLKILDVLNKTEIQNPYSYFNPSGKKWRFAVFLSMNFEKIKNLITDEEGNLNFYDYDLPTILGIGLYDFTLAEVEENKKIFSKLNEQHRKDELDERDIFLISPSITKMPNEGKNIFKDERGNFDFQNFDLETIYIIALYNFTSAELIEYKEILSLLEKLEQKDVESMTLKNIAAQIIMSPKEIKDNFVDENGLFNLKNLDYESIKTILYFSFSPSEFEEYSTVLSVLNGLFKSEDTNLELIANNFVRLSEEKKNTYKDQEGNISFENLDSNTISTIVEAGLTLSQGKEYLEILSILETIEINNPLITKDLRKKTALNIVNLPREFIEFYKDRQYYPILSTCGFINIYKLSQLDLIQFQNYIYLVGIFAIAPENAIYIAQDEELMERFKLIDPNIFWQGTTGESKEVFDLFDSVFSANGIMGNRLQEKDFDLELPKDCSFKFGNLKYSPIEDGEQGFNVELQKANKNSTPIMIVKNKNGEKESYIAYDGAIALFRELRMLTEDENGTLKEGLSSHSHFSEEEIKALSEAARHFIIDIIQENGECIISKGIDGIEKAEPFIGKELDTDTTKEKFKEIFQKLRNDSSSPNITIENILRLMPKDAIIQIRPYTTKTNSSHEMLYSISAEWHDSNGKKWDLRVHSHDLMYLDTNKHWIYRLGCQGEFYKPETNEFVSQDTKENKRDTHVLIESPENYENKLISNPYFQKTIRDISISFNKTQKIETIASELNIHSDDKEQKKNEIIAKCQQNAGYYYKYKKVIDNLLKEKGLFPLSSAA